MSVRINPWNQIGRLEREMLDFLQGRGFAPLADNGDARKAPTWQPAVDVTELADRIVLVADLPGLEEKDIQIDFENNVLTLRGERKPAEAQDGYRRVERVHGRFSRSFTVPATVDPEKIGASLRAGVLTVTLPKKAEVTPRQIKVTAAS